MILARQIEIHGKFKSNRSVGFDSEILPDFRRLIPEPTEARL
jgi:hypothetical protein